MTHTVWVILIRKKKFKPMKENSKRWTRSFLCLEFYDCPELKNLPKSYFLPFSRIKSTLVEGSVKEKFWIRDSAINSWRSPDSVLNWLEALVVEYWQPKNIIRVEPLAQFWGPRFHPESTAIYGFIDFLCQSTTCADLTFKIFGSLLGYRWKYRQSDFFRTLNSWTDHFIE